MSSDFTGNESIGDDSRQDANLFKNRLPSRKRRLTEGLVNRSCHNSLVSQRFNRIEIRRFVGRVGAEDDADE